jgi:selenocysteine lyase/cysteine desulfurase
MSKWRCDFPAIVNFPERIYCDNAATTQKPAIVIEAMLKMWETGVTAVGRTGGTLGVKQIQIYERSHDEVARFFGAKGKELIVTKSATEALNLVAGNIDRLIGREKPVVVLSRSNHSSVLAPFGHLAQANKIDIAWLNFEESGRVAGREYRQYLQDERVRMIVLPAVSNVLGVSENMAELARAKLRAQAKRKQPVYLVIDAAAVVTEMEINFDRLECDFLVVSAHKMFGPNLGGLLVRAEILETGKFLPKLMGGGNVNYQRDGFELMVDEKWRWRAGVVDLVGMVGWAQACQWLKTQQKEKQQYLAVLTKELMVGLRAVAGIRLLGSGIKKHLVSLVIDGYASQDIMAYLGSNGVVAREGVHCSQLVYQDLALAGSVRLSLAVYNTREEIARVSELLKRLPQVVQKN